MGCCSILGISWGELPYSSSVSKVQRHEEASLDFGDVATFGGKGEESEKCWKMMHAIMQAKDGGVRERVVWTVSIDDRSTRLDVRLPFVKFSGSRDSIVWALKGENFPEKVGNITKSAGIEACSIGARGWNSLGNLVIEALKIQLVEAWKTLEF
jgi:hypothetical protein